MKARQHLRAVQSRETLQTFGFAGWAAGDVLATFSSVHPPSVLRENS
jgi:hypothetical protein